MYEQLLYILAISKVFRQISDNLNNMAMLPTYISIPVLKQAAPFYPFFDI